ncbi:hypothetical protein O181_030075 [Austropuccinia psidii MF-1]|uniref:Uncharacterized protein n=1 Tax=Austropuccinia psidii MF-1 TaxID=1389203 RepID=A0A9Q3H5U8_9BASI|nr:hypothetical protein [Austropuccinia psidii MF-1]
MPLISEPESELIMGNSNSYKSHSEGSDRHLHEAVKEVLHGVQGQILGNGATNPQRRDELQEHPEKQWHNKKSEESKEEAPVASTSKPPQEGKRKKKKNWRKPYSPA